MTAITLPVIAEANYSLSMVGRVVLEAIEVRRGWLPNKSNTLKVDYSASSRIRGCIPVSSSRGASFSEAASGGIITASGRQPASQSSPVQSVVQPGIIGTTSKATKSGGGEFQVSSAGGAKRSVQ